MLALAIAALLQMADTNREVPDWVAVKQASQMWDGCVLAQAVILGKKSKEPATVVADAVEGLCRVEEAQFGSTMRRFLTQSDYDDLLGQRREVHRKMILGEVLKVRAK